MSRGSALAPKLLTWEQFATLDEGDEMHGVELVDGIVEEGEVTSRKHGRIVTRLVALLLPWLDASGGGELLTQDNRVRISKRRVRKPDLFVVRASDGPTFEYETLISAPYLVVEGVSDTKRDEERDRITKRAEYEQIGVRHYWIVDPGEDTLDALALDDDGLYGTATHFDADDDVDGARIGAAGIRFRVRDLSR
jgi:Uma2 family endonuclease